MGRNSREAKRLPHGACLPGSLGAPRNFARGQLFGGVLLVLMDLRLGHQLLGPP